MFLSRAKHPLKGLLFLSLFYYYYYFIFLREALTSVQIGRISTGSQEVLLPVASQSSR